MSPRLTVAPPLMRCRANVALGPADGNAIVRVEGSLHAKKEKKEEKKLQVAFAQQWVLG